MKNNSRIIIDSIKNRLFLIVTVLTCFLINHHAIADKVNLASNHNDKSNETITKFSCPAKWPKGDHPEWVLKSQEPWGNSASDFNSSDYYRGIDPYYQETFLLSCHYEEKDVIWNEVMFKNPPHALILRPYGRVQRCDADGETMPANGFCEVKLDKGQTFKPTIYIPEEVNQNTKLLGFHLNQSTEEVGNIAKMNGFICVEIAQETLDCRKDHDRIQIYFKDNKSYKLVQIGYLDSGKNKNDPDLPFNDLMVFRFGLLIDWDRRDGNPIRLKSVKTVGGGYSSSAVMLWDSRIEKDPPNPDLQ